MKRIYDIIDDNKTKYKTKTIFEIRTCQKWLFLSFFIEKMQKKGKFLGDC